MRLKNSTAWYLGPSSTRGEITEALDVAIELNAGAALAYSARVLEAHTQIHITVKVVLPVPSPASNQGCCIAAIIQPDGDRSSIALIPL